MSNSEKMFDPTKEIKSDVNMYGRVFWFGATALGLATAICWASQYLR